MDVNTDLKAAYDLFQHVQPRNESCYNSEAYLSTFTLDRDPTQLLYNQNQRIMSRYNLYYSISSFGWLLYNYCRFKDAEVCQGAVEDAWDQELMFFSELLPYALEYQYEVVDFYGRCVQNAPDCVSEDLRDYEKEYKKLQQIMRAKNPRSPLYYCAQIAQRLAKHGPLDVEILLKAARASPADRANFYGAALKRFSALFEALEAIQSLMQAQGYENTPRQLLEEARVLEQQIDSLFTLFQQELLCQVESNAISPDFFDILQNLQTFDEMPKFENYKLAAVVLNYILDLIILADHDMHQKAAKLAGDFFDQYSQNNPGYEIYLAYQIKDNFIRAAQSGDNSDKITFAQGTSKIADFFRDNEILQVDQLAKISYIFAVEEDLQEGYEFDPNCATQFIDYYNNQFQ